MKITVFLLFFSFGLFALPAAFGKEAKDLSPVESFDKSAKEADDAWGQAKKTILERYNHLIGQVEDAIRERESALDHGDPKIRDRINKERQHLEILRNHLKRRLAEISAAKTVDWIKRKEEFEEKLKDLKDSIS